MENLCRSTLSLPPEGPEGPKGILALLAHPNIGNLSNSQKWLLLSKKKWESCQLMMSEAAKRSVRVARREQVTWWSHLGKYTVVHGRTKNLMAMVRSSFGTAVTIKAHWQTAMLMVKVDTSSAKVATIKAKFETMQQKVGVDWSTKTKNTNIMVNGSMTYQTAKVNSVGKMVPITVGRSLTVKNMVKAYTNSPKANHTMVFSSMIFSMVLVSSS